MPKVINLWLFLILVISPKILVQCLKPNWTYDMVEVEVENKTPDIMFAQLELTRLRRGIFAFSGIIDVKEDLTDETHVEISSFYSFFGSDFARSPFGLPETTLSKFFDDVYKQFVMESILNCSENAPQIENTFVGPLTKRVIQLTDCMISNENWPSRLKSGFYKIIISFKNYAELSLGFLVKVEQE